MVDGSLYLYHLTTPTVTTITPTTSPDVSQACWSLVKHVCGSILVGGLLQSIPRHLGTHLGDVGRAGDGVGELLRKGMETLKEDVGDVGELLSATLTPRRARIYEIEEVEQGTLEKALGTEKEDQEKEKEDQEREKEQEQHRGVKKDSRFWDYDTQGTHAQGNPKMERVGGTGEGGSLPTGGRVQLSSPTADAPHQEKRRRSSHGTDRKSVV